VCMYVNAAAVHFLLCTLLVCVSLSLFESVNADRAHSYLALALVAIFLSLLDCLHRYAECGVLQFAN
jgi:hypothetical protein